MCCCGLPDQQPVPREDHSWIRSCLFPQPAGPKAHLRTLSACGSRCCCTLPKWRACSLACFAPTRRGGQTQGFGQAHEGRIRRPRAELQGTRTLPGKDKRRWPSSISLSMQRTAGFIQDALSHDELLPEAASGASSRPGAHLGHKQGQLATVIATARKAPGSADAVTGYCSPSLRQLAPALRILRVDDVAWLRCKDHITPLHRMSWPQRSAPDAAMRGQVHSCDCTFSGKGRKTAGQGVSRVLGPDRDWAA